jgi:hypothetical protein
MRDNLQSMDASLAPHANNNERNIYSARVLIVFLRQGDSPMRGNRPSMDAASALQGGAHPRRTSAAFRRASALWSWMRPSIDAGELEHMYAFFQCSSR